MRFTINSGDLLKQINRVHPVVPPGRAVMPIIENILVKVSDGMMHASATNLAVTATSMCPVISHGDEGFSAAIPAKDFKTLINAMPDQPVTLTLDGDDLNIKSDSGSYTIKCEDPANFPNIKEAPEPVAIIPAKWLGNAIDTVKPFADDDSSKNYAFNGILIEIREDSFSAVACTHKSLGRLMIKAENHGKVDIVLPSTSSHYVKAALSGVAGDAWISKDGSSVFFGCGESILCCSMMDVQYPNYGAIIHGGPSNVMSISKSDLLGCLSRMSICADTNQIGDKPVVMSVKDGVLRVSAHDVLQGRKAEEIVPCSYDGPDFEIGFGSKVLGGVIRAIPTEEILIKLGEPNRATPILPVVQEPGQEVFMLAMPTMLL